jgi:hypothetical protein
MGDMSQIAHYHPKGDGMMIKGLNYDETRYICDVIKEVRIYIR